MLKQYFLAGVMFSAYNIAFSTGLQTKYSNSEAPNITVNIVSLLLVLGVLYLLLCRNDEHFGEFNLKFKSTLMPRNYMTVSIFHRLVIGFLMAYSHDNPYITVANCFISIGFLLYIVSELPFNNGYQNYRSVFCQSCTIIILFIAMYYRSMKLNTELEIKGYILAPTYLKLAVIVLTVAISLAILCY